MVKRISKTEEIKNRLSMEGKLSYLGNSDEKMNKELEEIRRDHILKQIRSEQSASKTFIF